MKDDGWYKDDAEKIVAFDPYHLDQAVDWFDPYWMFGVNAFDIVMGNPPYISTKDVDKKLKPILEEEYGFADDLYSHFYFKGMELLRENGILAFISSKTFWTIQTKKNLRGLILKHQLICLFDTANPFESVMVDTCICIVKKSKASQTYTFTYIDGIKNLKTPVEKTASITYYKEAPNQVFFPINEYNISIFEKYVRKVNQLLNNWWDKISTSKNIEKYKNELEKYRQSLKPGDITLLGLITEGGVGIQTGNNGKYVGVLEGTKWAKKCEKTKTRETFTCYSIL